MAELRFESLSGGDIAPHLDALAAVRISVFREWPYLYEGTREYETKYLDAYLRAPRSLAVLVWDGENCIGATTALPLRDAGEDAQAPFIAAKHALDDIHYFGESVLLPDYRGRGIGVKFFDMREAQARALNLKTCAFCAVVRPDTHPARPAAYVTNDAFWLKRGYTPEPSLTSYFSWPDIGDTQSTAKPMRFWIKRLDA